MVIHCVVSKTGLDFRLEAHRVDRRHRSVPTPRRSSRLIEVVSPRRDPLLRPDVVTQRRDQVTRRDPKLGEFCA